MGSIMDSTILHHVCIVLILLWSLNSFYYCHPVAYFISFIYLYLVHEVYVMRLRKKLQFEERRDSNQRRVLTDSETVRWLNYAVDKMWLVCMEAMVSQKILLPVVPWFLQKYKPWTVKDAEIQHLYLGRSPPIFTEMRVLQNSNGDDHLVLEIGMNFRTADDMSAILGVKLRKRLGFGMWAKLHLLGLHVEGKVLVGVKFLRKWPFIGRLRVCFAGPPYFQMTVKPIFTHGLDVTELPGIAGWIDNLLALVFEQTLVEPNMLVVDVEKFVSSEQENWFSVDAKEPIAYAIVEVLDAAEMKPSDLNGLADPYVKGQLGPYRFRTKTQKKTLTPKWQEEFKIPICSWESQNMLLIEVRDKDHLFDDMMGDCCLNINEFRDGQRHDIWLPLQNIKMGRLHLAVTVSEGNAKVPEPSYDEDGIDVEYKRTSFAADSANQGSFSSRSSDKSPRVADKFEPIDIEGQSETGIWIHHPGSEVAKVWEPRKGKSRNREVYHLDGQVQGEGGGSVRGRKTIVPSSDQNDGSSTDDSVETGKSRQNPVHRGLKKISSVFRRSPRTPRPDDKPKTPKEPDSVPYNIRASNTKEVGVRLLVDDTILETLKDGKKESPDEGEPESPHIKDRAKGILKQAGKSARGLKLALSRKASRKFMGESGLSPADKDGKNSELDSSDEESLPSSTDIALAETGLVIPGSAVKSPALVPSTNTKDNVILSSPVKNVDEPGPTNIQNGDNSFKSDETTIKANIRPELSAMAT